MQPHDTTQKRFWSKVDRRGPDECWNWQAATSGGHGVFGFRYPRNTTAERASYYFAHPEWSIDSSERVLHTCDNSLCVNPAHLYLQFVGTPEECFWRFVTKGNPDDCWEWQGPRLPTEREYGFFRCEGIMYRAHAFSYELHHGPIPDGLYICHKCDNPPCVNPNHLFPGTNSENIIDCILKGRHGQAKLNAEAVREIRALAASGKSGSEIARSFGLNKTTVCRVISRKTWAYID